MRIGRSLTTLHTVDTLPIACLLLQGSLAQRQSFAGANAALTLDVALLDLFDLSLSPSGTVP